MNEPIADREMLWDKFLEIWPLENLPNMFLKQYTQADSKETLTYWMEFGTQMLGSMRGGGSFKFGIYCRKGPIKEQREHFKHDDIYSWYAKYGSNHEEAFEKVRALIVECANAARQGNIEAIDSIDLGDVYKWKLAFLYQNRQTPCLLPIYKFEHLQAAIGTAAKGLKYPGLYRHVMKGRGDGSVFGYADALWNKVSSILAEKLTPEDALTYFNSQPDRFAAIKPPSQYIAGFNMPTGRQIALARENKETTLFLSPGAWLDTVRDQLGKIQEYEPNKSRNSNLTSNAPDLAEGKPAVMVRVPTKAALIALCDAYDDTDFSESEPMNTNNPETHLPNVSLNQIIYGPPGTGKTYSTALRAVQICAPDWPSDASDPEVRAKYEEFRKAGRISFVTFHQSYGYEDFVEGLRPVLQTSGQVSYSVVPGAFRRACDSARLPNLVDPGLSGKPLQERKIFKMSLGASWNDEGVKVFKYCLENRCVLMGWGADVDFSDCGNAESIGEKLKQEAPDIDKFKSQVAFVDRFKNELAVGDILVVSHGNKAFRGIAEVTGEYEFDEDGPFHQARPVKWLAVFESGRPASEVNAKDFTMRSLHQLHDVNYEGLQALLVPASEFEEAQPHVLIIDEINRANISKVFGELITLLEPDKREGMPNAITLKLAYSGDDFTVPSNLYVLGTMNTADRSIALLDTALRRRFEFEELQPDYETLPGGLVEGVDLRAMLKAMNDRIEYLYDRDHTIGHAYFMGVDSLEKLQRVFRHKIIPLLQEYFYEDWAKVRLALNDKDGAFIKEDNIVPKGLESTADGYDPKPRYKVRDREFPLEAYLKIYQ
ncbi:hypothetical protein SCT_1017 [Sulfuricella sp. T08]|uniref:AAA family ATPase n=1 Tax=Sulfuricella sp. T08 TaxID=1632857 RepID=UPI0006179954|nr:AAA family ATPase [Sulfuricella sp. T08]GAO35626.1 hypothetical protein SCT_1017 [Sulfuricella sp. T08]